MSDEDRPEDELRVLRAGSDGRRIWYCPGCREAHLVITGSGEGPRWEWNGSEDSPTFSPSILTRGTKRCHVFITDGKIQYLGDCEHDLAGKTVDLMPYKDWWT